MAFLKKIGLVMRKVQFGEAQGPRVWAERLREIGRELGVDVVFISPERHVAADRVLPGYEHERGDLVNYDIVLNQLHEHRIEHVLYTVAGFSFLKMYMPNSVLFPHSFPDPALPDSHLMLPFYQMVDKAIVQTQYLKDRMADMDIRDVTVIPIGLEESLADAAFDPSQVVGNRVLWIGRDDPNRRPEAPIEFARQNPQAEVCMVFGGRRYEESIRRFDIPSNVKLYFALSRAEIFALMNSAKAYFCSSRFDTFAMPLAEAMAMGKYIVRPEHPCYGHIAGRHVFAGNPENWFELLRMTLAAPAKVSHENRAIAMERFTTHVMRAGYRDFFERWLS